jgi:peptidyl-prolyl cis-trans isomerase B (cyclophilin B)
VIATVAVVVVAVVGVVLWITIGRDGGDTVKPAAASCSFPSDSGQPPARPVSAPTNNSPPREGTVAVTLDTSQGVIPLTLDRAKAPCTVESFVHLAGAGFYNGTPCHRLSTADPLHVLQCGDPSGTGTGGPGYLIPDEPPTDLTPAASPGVSVYPRGTVAMAKRSTPNSGGSQFFLVYANSQLSPEYTVFGTIAPEGLPVLDAIASKGHNGAFEAQAGGGRPNVPVTINTVKVS